MIPVHTSIILDTRRPLKDGTYPVKLRITYQRQRKYYNTNYSLSEEDFSKTQGEKPKGKYKTIQLSLNATEQKANAVIDKLPSFTFEGFEKKFLNRASRDEVFSTYEKKIEKLREEGQAGTASTYESAYYSFLSYFLKEAPITFKGTPIKEIKKRREELLNKKKPLPFSAITIDFLSGYEKWMLSRGKTLTSVSMYVRTLRTLFNDVIATGDLSKELYLKNPEECEPPIRAN